MSQTSNILWQSPLLGPELFEGKGYDGHAIDLWTLGLCYAICEQDASLSRDITIKHYSRQPWHESIFCKNQAVT